MADGVMYSVHYLYSLSGNLNLFPKIYFRKSLRGGRRKEMEKEEREVLLCRRGRQHAIGEDGSSHAETTGSECVVAGE